MYIYIYIYIYIYTCVCVYIYIYIYIHIRAGCDVAPSALAELHGVLLGVGVERVDPAGDHRVLLGLRIEQWRHPILLLQVH